MLKPIKLIYELLQAKRKQFFHLILFHFLCMCVSTCVCMFVYRYAVHYMHLCRAQRLTSGTFLHCSFIL